MFEFLHECTNFITERRSPYVPGSMFGIKTILSLWKGLGIWTKNLPLAGFPLLSGGFSCLYVVIMVSICTGTTFYMITLETIDESLRSEKTRILEFGHTTLLGTRHLDKGQT